MSKRKLLKLVEEGHVKGWDDPRMPTISGLRRRGYTPEAIREFVNRVGVAKRDNVIDVSLLEFCIREDLNQTAPRVMAVLDPVKLVIDNYPEGKEEWLEAENNPEDESAGSRKVPFTKTLFIEREDFMENANSKYFRLTLGKEVRLKNAYIIKGESVEKDSDGKITVIHCTYDPESLSGSGTEASLRKVKGTLHWVSVEHAIEVEVREYDRLFMDEAPDGNPDKDFLELLNPDSLIIKTAFVEPSLTSAEVGERYQFQRLGYFCVDTDSKSDQLVFNKTVGLRDTWAKVQPVQNQPSNKSTSPKQDKRPAIEIIKQIGKKYTNYPEEKQLRLKSEIIELAKNVKYSDLEPLFNTSVKKVGTRIAVVLSLGVVLKKDSKITQDAKEFLEQCASDSSETLSSEANEVLNSLG